MHVLVIGPGAVGVTYGLLFEKTGHTVYFQSRRVDSLEKLTVYFQELEQHETITNPQIHCQPSQFFSPPTLDLIIIALKTTENHLLENILSRHTFDDKTIFLVLQNGIGNEEHLANIVPNNPIICGVTNVAAVKTKPHFVNVTRLGVLKLAPLKGGDGQALTQIEDALSASRINANLSRQPNHKQIRFEKLLWNIPFNSLATLCRVPASHLVLEANAQRFVRHLMLEVIQIAASDGILIAPDNINRLLEATIALGEYHPSMYTDFVHGRPIESEYIIQNALNIAIKNHVDTPLLRWINQQLSITPLPEIPMTALNYDNLDNGTHIRAHATLSARNSQS